VDLSTSGKPFHSQELSEDYIHKQVIPLANNKITTDNYPAARKEIAAGDTLPVYFICGSESFFIDSLQQDIIKSMPEDLRDFNMDVFYGNETGLSSVITAARSFPMMANKRIVILRDLSASQSKTKVDPSTDSDSEVNTDTSEDSTIEELLTYMERPNPSTILVITDKKLPGNTRLGKLVNNSQHIAFAKFEPINENQLPQWIQKWTQIHYNIELEHQASSLIVERIGPDLQAITSQLSKIANGKKTGESITYSDIESHVVQSKEVNIFDLKDAVNRKNVSKSLQLAERMLRNTKTTEVGEVLRLLSFFYSYYGNIWQILRLTQKGISSPEMRNKIGVKSEFYFNNLVKESKSYTFERLHNCYEAIVDADKAIKGFSKLEPLDILVMFIRRVT
jgi:DNA polymerase III subunit delta